MSIEAMKLMVHELEYVLDCINKDKIPFDGDDFHEALRLGRQAIEQAEKQEPVAWIKRSAKGNIIDLLNEPDNGAEPLYTHPPKERAEGEKREWVGLTDEDIEKLAVENGQATFLNDDEETGIIWFDGDATPFAQAIAEFNSHTLYREGYVNGYAFGEAAGKRQTISELESQDGVCQHCAGKGCVACDAREQEPVAWAGVDFDIKTYPPKREWVGLTKEEVKEISFANRPYVVDMVVALEAKLKEKNT